jgi:SAM-dependent methyltransferase
LSRFAFRPDDRTRCSRHRRDGQYGRVPDAIFEDPRLAQVYDPLDPDRSDLDAYVAMVEELGVESVLDVGCGTGTLACMLAGRGVSVVGVDPALASLDVARDKRGAERVQWIHGDATNLPPMQLDAAVMTGNVAQVFVADDAWLANLCGIHGALRPDGWLIFETRDPSRRAWERWTPELTHRTTDVNGVGVVESWHELLDVDGRVITFRSMTRFQDEDLVIESRSTLRFRDRSELEASLATTGYNVIEIRDAPDRPGLEHVVIAHRR